MSANAELESTPAAPAAEVDTEATSSSALQEIVVVAQKRAENLQKVPIAVTTVSSDQLATSGVSDLQNLPAAVPGLTVLNIAGQYSPRLRGVGTSVVEAGIEPGVATYVDGVYYANSADLGGNLDDVAAIYVLKGPQGTLFGRNATGGVIQINTFDPTQTFTASMGSSIDNYLTSRTDAYVSGGLSDKLSAGLSVQYAGQGLGWGKNINNDTDIDKIDHDGTVRGKAIYEWNDATTVRLGVDYSNHEGTNATNFRPFPGYSVLFPVPQSSNPWDSDSYVHTYNKYQGGGASVIVDHDLGDAKFSSVTAYRNSDSYFQFSPTASSVPSEDIGVPQKSEQITQELQLVSQAKGPLDWAVGVFYFWERAQSSGFTINLHGPLAVPFSTIIIPGLQATHSVAGYGQATYKITPQTRLTIGARYTYERKVLESDETGTFANGGPTITLVPQPTDNKVSFEKPTWRLALDHDFTDSILGYVSYNRGFKSGGFNIEDPTNPAFQPEQLDAYEIGVKSEIFDHRLRLNTAVFDYEYKNVQVAKYTFAQEIVNGAKARIYGIDEDIVARITDPLSFTASLEWLHARFLDFPDATFSIPNPGFQGATLTSGNASGNVIPYTPKFTYTLGPVYTIPTASGDVILTLTDNYNSGFYGDADNRLFQPSYHFVGASVSWQSPDTHLTFRLFGNNLLDKAVVSQMATLNTGYLADYSNPPRIYGASFKYKF
ncbi:MAG TPA: TonB-dependent receptor [Steroidobacteraceae bacterium]|jgi:outer membrane receptor protein involved in Fe transport